MMLPDVCLCVCRVHIQVAFVENWQIIAVGHIQGILCREQRPRKTKIDTKVAHVTRDSQTTFKVKRSKVKVMCEAGHIVAASCSACL